MDFNARMVSEGGNQRLGREKEIHDDVSLSEFQEEKQEESKRSPTESPRMLFIRICLVFSKLRV